MPALVEEQKAAEERCREIESTTPSPMEAI